MPKMDAGGLEFELEKNWILAHAATFRVKRDAEIAKKLRDEAEWAAGGGVECGCCFDDFLPVSDLFPVLGLADPQGDMFQCRDGHLFCKECCVRHTETKLGDEVHVSVSIVNADSRSFYVWTPQAVPPDSTKRSSLVLSPKSHWNYYNVFDSRKS